MPKHTEYMRFLLENLPQSDIDSYPYSLFSLFAVHAEFLRGRYPRCAALEEDIFLQYVLFPRVNNEDLSFHREIFFNELESRIEGLDTENTVLEVNRWCHENASYRLQDERTASPLTVFRSGYGRCGEESAFLVSALRSVGIAARQVYVPRWAHCDDNHAWVEALCGDKWRFLGACEPEPILDKGWFNSAATRAPSVRSMKFTRNGLIYENQTARYAETADYRFTAARGKLPASGIPLTVSVLNGAEYSEVYRLLTNTGGYAEASLGIGSFLVSIGSNGFCTEKLCDGRNTREFFLELEDSGLEPSDWTEKDFFAPCDSNKNTYPLSDAQKADKIKTLEYGNKIRLSVKRPAPLSGRPLLLEGKDLLDADPASLENHMCHTRKYTGDFPVEIYEKYLLCPRIGFEMITPWRSVLADASCETPEEILDWLNKNIKLTDRSAPPGLFWFIEAAFEKKRCDAVSRDILHVALLRAKGIPARLNPVTNLPEYYRNGKFVPAEKYGTAELILTKQEDKTPLYGQNWTVARFNKGSWKTMRLSDDGWKGPKYMISLPAGCYRLLTSVRKPDGNQLAAEKRFELSDGGKYETDLYFRKFDIMDGLTKTHLPLPEGILPQNGLPSLLFWLEEGKEPTEHLLNELIGASQEIRWLSANIYFFLKSPESALQPTLGKALETTRAVPVYGDFEYNLDQLARRLYRDPGNPPLSILCDDDGDAVYSESGYKAGAVSILLEILKNIRRKL